MATRERLSKLKVEPLKKLAEDLNLNTKKRKKEDIISDILNIQTQPSILTPVVLQVSQHQAVTPNLKENLPPFTRVHYDKAINTFPKITFKMIYDFMVSRESAAGNCAANFKGLDRAVRHYDAGDLQDVGFSQVDESTIYVTAFCQASMKKQRYQVFLCLTQRQAEDSIDYAFCQCPVGLAQACSHIGGLLITLSNLKPDRSDSDLSCTSKLCEWKKPRSTVKPQPLSSMKLNRPKLLTEEDNNTAPSLQTHFDPRHSDDRKMDLSNTLQHLQKLKVAFPNTGLAMLWNIPDQVPDTVLEVELTTTVNPLQTQMENMVFTNNNLPPVEIETELVNFIEKETRQQRQSDIWQKLHHGRLTSSLFAEVLNSGGNPRSLVKTIIEGSNLDRYARLPEAVQWGIDNEGKARKDYIKLKEVFTNISVEETGLTLYASHSFLGASSDGRVREGDSMGIMEIKCPFSLDGTNITKMEVPDILALNSKSFCLIQNENGPALKRNHKYYVQVQGEMAIMGMPWCDFVLWTAAERNNIFIERIYFDAEFVTNMMPKLVAFYIEHIYPVYYNV